MLINEAHFRNKYEGMSDRELKSLRNELAINSYFIRGKDSRGIFSEKITLINSVLLQRREDERKKLYEPINYYLDGVKHMEFSLTDTHALIEVQGNKVAMNLCHMEELVETLYKRIQGIKNANNV